MKRRRVGGRVSQGPTILTLLCGAAIVTLLAVIAAGCTMELEAPTLEVTSAEAYPSSYVLLPYEIRGDETETRARWLLRKYRSDLDVWELIDTWDTFAVSGRGAILQLDNLDDGLYELTGQLLTTRGGVTTAYSTLTSQTQFFVDTVAPWDGIEVATNQDTFGPPWDSSQQLEVYPSYAGSVDPDHESPVQIHFVLDTTVQPTAESEVSEGVIELWDGTGSPSSNRLLALVAVDQAGNVGSRHVEIYSAP